MNKPIVVIINRFLSEKTKPSKRKYYQDGHYIRYITREDAVAKNDLSLDELKQLKDESKNEEEYQELLSSKINKNATGLWNKDGQLTPQDKDNLDANLKNLDPTQCLWDMIISFPKWLVDKFELYTPVQIHEIVKNTINDYFEQNNFNPNKMSWFFAFHTNTNNPHIHLGFHENTPQYYDKKSKSYQYRRKGVLDTNKTKGYGLKMQTYLENDIDYYTLRKIRNQATKISKISWKEAKQIYCDINAANNPLKKELFHLVRVMRKQKHNVERKKFFYNQQSPFIKNKINKVTDLLIHTDPNLQTKLSEFNHQLNDYQQLLENKTLSYITKNKKTKKDEPLIINFKQEQLYGKDGLYARIGNQILQDIKDLITNKIPLNPKQPSNVKPPLIPKWPTNTNHWSKLVKSLDNHFFKATKQAERKFQQLQSQVLRELVDNKN